MSFFKWIQSLLGRVTSTAEPKNKAVPLDIVAWAHAQAQSMRPQLTSDAFGGPQGFSTESDMDKSRMLQRERLTKNGMIDFGDRRFNPPTKCVTLLGGPYDGREALVVKGTMTAWVIGGWEYVNFNNTDTWFWSHNDEE